MAKTVAFYRNFLLDLGRLSSALRCVAANPTASQDQLAVCMGVNTPVAKSFSAWLRHTGLIAATEDLRGRSPVYSLTAFGKLVVEHDPMLRDIGTLWVMHYYLASQHQECSDAWRLLINDFISPGLSFTSAQFGEYFGNAVSHQVSNRAAFEKDPQAALSAYVRSEVLGKLGLLSRDKDAYIVGRPAMPNALVVGYVLFDRWQRIHSETDTLRFSLLCEEPENIGRIFLAERAQIRLALADLSGRGYLNFAETQHEPVNRLYTGAAAALLERYYKQR